MQTCYNVGCQICVKDVYHCTLTNVLHAATSAELQTRIVITSTIFDTGDTVGLRRGGAPSPAGPWRIHPIDIKPQSSCWLLQITDRLFQV